tara:strand:+ start:58847 stop:59011 length:165 start_codon:yes stop_codon:yes gene_type:complete
MVLNGWTSSEQGAMYDKAVPMGNYVCFGAKNMFDTARIDKGIPFTFKGNAQLLG